MKLVDKLTRCKSWDSLSSETSLHRCLTTPDLILLGIGGMVGSGIYILTGVASKNVAGPGIIFSFMIAAATVSLAAVCLTEFACRIHKTGSVYLYMYLTFGELCAFLVGISALFGTVTGAAVNARAWSAYLDFLFQGAIVNSTKSYIAEWTFGPPVAEYPDFLAAAIVIALTGLVAIGARCSTIVNIVLVTLNISMLLFVSITGLVFGERSNWAPDEGGLLPFGFSGVLQASGMCFWAFTGFEVIAVSVEEAKNPKKSVPIGIGVAILFVMFLYMGTSAGLTSLVPYYEIDAEAPLPSAFFYRGITWAQYIVSIGPLLGLTGVLFLSIFGFTRMTYAMAEDGLLMNQCSTVNKCNKVPLLPTLFGGGVTAIIALFCDLGDIISVGVILSLSQYILVACSVIILRYQPAQGKVAHSNGIGQQILYRAKSETLEYSAIPCADENTKTWIGYPALNNRTLEAIPSETCEFNGRPSILADGGEENVLVRVREELLGRGPGVLDSRYMWLKPLAGLPPGRWPFIASILMALVSLLLSFCLVYAGRQLLDASWWVILIVVFLMLSLVLLDFSVFAHVQNLQNLVIKVPFVPATPTLTILTCSLLMAYNITLAGFIAFVVLIAVALVIYFTYAIRHSKLNPQVPEHERKSGRVRGLNLGQHSEVVGLLDDSDEEDITFHHTNNVLRPVIDSDEEDITFHHTNNVLRPVIDTDEEDRNFHHKNSVLRPVVDTDEDLTSHHKNSVLRLVHSTRNRQDGDSKQLLDKSDDEEFFEQHLSNK